MIELGNYDGGKGNIFRHLINQIPPHDTFISAFAGGCSITLHKRYARRNIMIDRDPAVIAAWVDHLSRQGFRLSASSSAPKMGAPIVVSDGGFRWELYVGDARKILPRLRLVFNSDVFIYADPPYLMSTRSSQRPLYAYEMGAEHEHAALIRVLKWLPCRVMLSGYASGLYADLLSDWRVEQFAAYDRANKMRLEHIWCNYPAPLRLHDYSYLGDNFRERERIKRKADRWVNRFESLPVLERQAILGELEAAGVLR